MTTIAYRAGVMAADSLCTGQYNHSIQKIYHVKDSIVGFAGHISSCLLFIDWLNGGEDKPDLDEESFCALVVSKRGIEYYDSKLRAVKMPGTYHAIGSGADYAMGAMAMGADAVGAVKVARKFDCKTGGAIKKAVLK